MEINIELNNLAKNEVKKPFFKAVAEKTLKSVKYKFLSKKTISISIALVDPKEIKKFNRTYRKKDSVTDILSFCEYSNLAKIKREKNKDIFLGELILCYDDINKYAKNEGIILKRELEKVVAHGVLHLLGFKHGKKMFALQEKITKKEK